MQLSSPKSCVYGFPVFIFSSMTSYAASRPACRYAFVFVTIFFLSDLFPVVLSSIVMETRQFVPNWFSLIGYNVVSQPIEAISAIKDLSG